jgi:hypothetical protein
MDNETAYEALSELRSQGPYKHEALDLLAKEIQLADFLRAREKNAINNILSIWQNALPSEQERFHEFIQGCLCRSPNYASLFVINISKSLTP